MTKYLKKEEINDTTIIEISNFSHKQIILFQFFSLSHFPVLTFSITVILEKCHFLHF